MSEPTETAASDMAARPRPHLSSFAPGNLGLKIGVRYGKGSEQAGFVPILGWVTVSNYVDAGTMALTPVVRGLGNHPVLASPSTVQGFIGLFPIEAAVKDLAESGPGDRPL